MTNQTTRNDLETNSIEKLILNYREKAKLTQPKLAKVVGVTRKTICSWETGFRGITENNVYKLIEGFLKLKVFIPGHEAEEAENLWTLACEKNKSKGYGDKVDLSRFKELRGTNPGRSSLPKNNLPTQLTSFIGREQEILQVETQIFKSQSRLLTLTGTGGIGKTRIALQVASGLLDKFGDGIWLVDLSTISDPSLIPQTISTIFGLGDRKSTRLNSSH